MRFEQVLEPPGHPFVPQMRKMSPVKHRRGATKLRLLKVKKFVEFGEDQGANVVNKKKKTNDKWIEKDAADQSNLGYPPFLYSNL